MSTCQLIALYIIAGIFEGAGLALVVTDLVGVRNRLRRYRSTKHVFGRAGLAASAGIAGGATVTGGQGPTTEQRIAALEQQAQAAREQRDKDLTEMRRYADEQADSAVDFTQKSLGSELQRLADLVLDVNDAPSPWWRAWWIGPLLLAVGLILGVVGNVASAA